MEKRLSACNKQRAFYTESEIISLSRFQVRATKAPACAEAWRKPSFLYGIRKYKFLAVIATRYEEAIPYLFRDCFAALVMTKKGRASVFLIKTDLYPIIFFQIICKSMDC
ncbi:MAG: hypothetical protein H6Q68_1650 [Firmicutes bacterium]|nr:hypothetical protein [Bacillota bacterium]